MNLEALNQQIELQAMYRDDKFAAKLKELQAQYKQTQDAQKALDTREKAVALRSREAEVVLKSQETFNKQKAEAEAHNLTVSQRNQATKDKLAADVIGVAATKDVANSMKEDAEKLLRSAKSKNGLAEAKLRKAEDAEEAALKYKAAYEKRLSDLGLKAA